jgi:hypothetical protein
MLRAAVTLGARSVEHRFPLLLELVSLRWRFAGARGRVKASLATLAATRPLPAERAPAWLANIGAPGRVNCLGRNRRTLECQNAPPMCGVPERLDAADAEHEMGQLFRKLVLWVR